MTYPLDKSSKARKKGVNGNLFNLFMSAKHEYEETYVHNIQIAWMGGKRYVSDQKKLYAKGRTEPGRIVTYIDGITKVSMHQKGLAIDIVIKDKNKIPIWDEENFRNFADIIKRLGQEHEIKIGWGGDWKAPDNPHFQYNNP